MSRRLLLISYCFPPVGGGGVQRAVKFCKHLPRHGWEVSVLTAENPSTPVSDDSLSHDVPGPTLVRRSRTWEPSYRFKQRLINRPASKPGQGGMRRRMRRLTAALLQPDPQILWLPSAVRAGRKLLQQHEHDAILATGPPFSVFLVGAALAGMSGLPLVLDYRDEWSLSNTYQEHRLRDPISAAIQRVMQTRVLRRSAGLLTTTQASAAHLQQLCHAAGSNAWINCIYNGYDADDFINALPVPRQDDRRRVQLTYTGTLWRLTDVRPLVQAVHRLTERSPQLASRFELLFVGRRVVEQDAILDQLDHGTAHLVRRDYCDHRQSIAYLKSADALCLLLADVPGSQRVVPAKLFEYLAARKPVLAIVPPGESADLLQHSARTTIIAPHDIAGITEYLARLVSGAPLVASTTGAGDALWQRFSRHRQTGELAAMLDELVSTQYANGWTQSAVHSLEYQALSQRVTG